MHTAPWAPANARADEDGAPPAVPKSEAFSLFESLSSATYARCLSCPPCCLTDGVTPLPRATAMGFSAPHAAAAAGQLDVLRWLETHASGGDRGQVQRLDLTDLALLGVQRHGVAPICGKKSRWQVAQHAV